MSVTELPPPNWVKVTGGKRMRQFCQEMGATQDNPGLPPGILIRTVSKNWDGSLYADDNLLGDCDSSLSTIGCGCCSEDAIPRDAVVIAYVDLRPLVSALKGMTP